MNAPCALVQQCSEGSFTCVRLLLAALAGLLAAAGLLQVGCCSLALAASPAGAEGGMATPAAAPTRGGGHQRYMGRCCTITRQQLRPGRQLRAGASDAAVAGRQRSCCRPGCRHRSCSGRLSGCCRDRLAAQCCGRKCSARECGLGSCRKRVPCMVVGASPANAGHVHVHTSHAQSSRRGMTMPCPAACLQQVLLPAWGARHRCACQPCRPGCR